MHTTTKTYLELKTVYKHQHEVDVAKIEEYLLELVGHCQLSREEISNYIENLEALSIVHLG